MTVAPRRTPMMRVYVGDSSLKKAVALVFISVVKPDGNSNIKDLKININILIDHPAVWQKGSLT